MTLDEAIKHAIEESRAKEDCKCANEHLQLAKWLAELKELMQEKSECIEPIDDCLGCKWEKINYDGEPCPQCARAFADHYTPKG